MRLSILQQDLLAPLQAVSRSVGVRSSLPVLANILLQAQGGKLILSATNLEIGVVKQVNAQVNVEGEVTVPAKMLVEVVSSLPNTTIDLDSSEDKLQISTKSFKATLNGIPAGEFPAIPLASDQEIFLSGKILKVSLPEIAFAAASDEGRPILTGILTQIKQGNMELVATDGFRLSHKKVALEEGGKTSFGAIIPRRTFEELVRLIQEELESEEEDTISLATSENQNQVIFSVGSTKLSSRLIEGQFPTWEKIIPSNAVNRTIIDRHELLKAVKLASVFARGEGANIIKIETNNSNLKISSETKELGMQETQVDSSCEGEVLEVAFNSKFLIDSLSACNSSQVMIEFSGNLSAAIIKPMGEEYQGLEYIIMPVRLS